MTKLSDTQALILSAAAQRPDRIALPLPESLRGGAASKVIGAMIAAPLATLRVPCATSRRLAPSPSSTALRHRSAAPTPPC